MVLGLEKVKRDDPLNYCFAGDFDRKIYCVKKERHITDILWLLLYITWWGAVLTVLIVAIDNGAHPKALIRGADLNGRICGLEPGTIDKPYTAWPNVLQYQVTICVEDCSVTSTVPFNASVSVMGELYETKPFLYYCIPLNTSYWAGKISNNFESAVNLADRAVADLQNGWIMIVASIFLAFILSYGYAKFVQYFASYVIWGTLAIIFLGLLLITIGLLYAGYNSELPNNLESDRGNVTKVFGWIMFSITVLFLALVYFMQKRIQIAIGIVQTSGRALWDMKWMVFFPIIPVCVAALYVFFWIVVSLYIFSVTIPEERNIPYEVSHYNDELNYWGLNRPSGTYQELEWNKELKNSFYMHFFHLLWTLQFLVYFTYLILAGACADWYFTPVDENGNKPRGEEEGQLTEYPILESFKRSIYHLGGVALASLIIAIIEFLRWTFRYVEKKSKDITNDIIRKVLTYVVSCFLWCLKCCLDRINRNGLIWIAIWGSSFCAGAYHSFKLVWENLARFAFITVVGDYIIFLGKFFVAIVTAGISAMVFSTDSLYDKKLSSVLLPTLIVFILAYAIASLFMSIFEVAIDTMFICFLVDEKSGADHFCAELNDVLDEKQLPNPKAEREEILDEFSRRAEIWTKTGRGPPKRNADNSVLGTAISGMLGWFSTDTKSNDDMPGLE